MLSIKLMQHINGKVRHQHDMPTGTAIREY